MQLPMMTTWMPAVIKIASSSSWPHHSCIHTTCMNLNWLWPRVCNHESRSHTNMAAHTHIRRRWNPPLSPLVLPYNTHVMKSYSTLISSLFWCRYSPPSASDNHQLTVVSVPIEHTAIRRSYIFYHHDPQFFYSNLYRLNRNRISSSVLLTATIITNEDIWL